MTDIRERKIAQFLKNPEQMADYRAGVALLQKSGVLDLLILLGIPKLVAEGSNANIQITQAAWANGWHSAMDCLEDLENRYQHLISEPQEMPLPSYSNMDMLIKQGLTKKELQLVKGEKLNDV